MCTPGATCTGPSRTALEPTVESASTSVPLPSRAPGPMTARSPTTHQASRRAPVGDQRVGTDETHLGDDGAAADTSARQQLRGGGNARRRIDGDSGLGVRGSANVGDDRRVRSPLRRSDAQAGSAGSRRTRIHDQTSWKGTRAQTPEPRVSKSTGQGATRRGTHRRPQPRRSPTRQQRTTAGRTAVKRADHQDGVEQRVGRSPGRENPGPFLERR